MTRDARQPEGVARPALPYSPVVVTGDLVFTAGQVALEPGATWSPEGSKRRPGRCSTTSRAVWTAWAVRWRTS